MKTYLKIKISSLAAEARIIRREEQRWPGDHHIRTGLHEHRVIEVRRDARSALLAYGFLRHRAYRTIEPKCHRAPDWKRTQQLVEVLGAGLVFDVENLQRAYALDQLCAVEGHQRIAYLSLS